MLFKTNKKFIKSSHHIIDIKLCSIRLHDNSKFPWAILIPKRNKISEMCDLNFKDQVLLIKEIVYVGKIMKKLFKSSKFNVKKLVILFHNYTCILLQELTKIAHGNYLYGLLKVKITQKKL